MLGHFGGNGGTEACILSRLVALLNMLASEFDGERANAARMIATMAEKDGKTVADFVMSPQVVYRVVEKTVRPDRPRSAAPKSDELVSGLRWAQNFPEHLSGFEAEFIDSILKIGLPDLYLTSRQEKVARRIIAKVKSYEEGPLI